MEEYLIPNKVERIMNKNRRPKRSSRSSLVKILAFCIPLGIIGIVGGIDYYLSIPISYQAANLNGDEKPDLVITYRDGRTQERVQMEDGNYRFLSRAEKEEIKEEARIQFYLENKVPFFSSDL